MYTFAFHYYCTFSFGIPIRLFTSILHLLLYQKAVKFMLIWQTKLVKSVKLPVIVCYVMYAISLVTATHMFTVSALSSKFTVIDLENMPIMWELLSVMNELRLLFYALFEIKYQATIKTPEVAEYFQKYSPSNFLNVMLSWVSRTFKLLKPTHHYHQLFDQFPA